MRDQLVDIVNHTHKLGIFETIKVIGTDAETKLEGEAEDKSVIMRGEFKDPMSDFMGIKKSDSIDNFYEIDQVIGRGAFGEVVKARHLFSNEERAIKIIEKQKL